MAGISLFDAARLMCAVANCLHAWPKEELEVEALPTDRPLFALVAARLSGAEAFVQPWAERGDLAVALGRAFTARLMAEHVADEVLGALGLSGANALYRTDTEFMLLCPHVPALAETVDAVAERVNRWLWGSWGTTAHWGLALVPAVRRGNTSRREALRNAYKRLLAAGTTGLHYVPGEPMLGDDGDGTVDGSHPTDLGFVRMADYLEPILRSVLGE